MKFKLDRIENDRRILNNIFQVIKDRYYMFMIRDNYVGLYTFYNQSYCNGNMLLRPDLIHFINSYHNKTRNYLENEDGRIGFKFVISTGYLGYSNDDHEKFKTEFIELFEKSSIYKKFEFTIEKTVSYATIHIVYNLQEDFLESTNN